MEMEMQSSHLVRLCIDAACQSREAVEKWRRQRRTLERMPSPIADALLRRLLDRRLLSPSLLEVFKHSVEEVDLRGEKTVDAEWMAYLGAFRYLRSLNISDCHKITSSALWTLTGMATLKGLDLSRCMKVTDAGIRHLLSILTLEKLCISETGVTADGVTLLSSLTNLSVLDLGGLPVTDLALSSLKELKNLHYLDLWGSKVSNEGVAVLQLFPKLSYLNLAWTCVTTLPNLPSLECLNLSSCTINSIIEGNGDKAPLAKAIFSGTTFTNEAEAFLCIDSSFLSFLDVSNSSLRSFCFLSYLKVLEHLDLSSSMMGDDSVELVACVGANLRNLNLSKTRVTSAGIGLLAGHVPSLEVLTLSHTAVDDAAISFISTMPSLKVIDLSNTSVKGFIHQLGAEPHAVPSLTALCGLNHLERLNLEQTQVRDVDLIPLSNYQELSYLSFQSAFLTDVSLHQLSSLPRLSNLCIRDAVLTNLGLSSFIPPSTLTMLDLRGCWLLTDDAIVSFCKNYPQIELWHELVHITPSDQSGSNHPSPSRTSWRRASQVSRKQGKSLISQPKSESFLDQRLKYSKEELLALQHSSVSLPSPYHRGNVIRKNQAAGED